MNNLQNNTVNPQINNISKNFTGMENVKNLEVKKSKISKNSFSLDHVALHSIQNISVTEKNRNLC